MVSLHKPDHTSVMNIIKRLCRSIGSVVWLVKTNYLSARYTPMGFGPTQSGPYFSSCAFFFFFFFIIIEPRMKLTKIKGQ